ncbi:hypothetical protein LBMAG48_13420 [Phycisphaerae bacterium]|nr:hypothetical protein LBMAG48_13420 [Phycisphaerae bacterium]
MEAGDEEVDCAVAASVIDDAFAKGSGEKRTQDGTVNRTQENLRGETRKDVSGIGVRAAMGGSLYALTLLGNWEVIGG